MAIREIRVVGDRVLTKKCRPVEKMTPRISELIDDMFDTMYEANGVGLAAPQVGILKRIVVMDVDGTPHLLINPEILEGLQVKLPLEGLHRSVRIYPGCVKNLRFLLMRLWLLLHLLHH